LSNLPNVAEQKGVYRTEIDVETQKFVDDACGLSGRVAELQCELGRVLLVVGDSRRKNGLRVEDVLECKVRIGKSSARVATTVYAMGEQGVGADVQTAATKQHDAEKYAAIITAGREGKSIVQVKKAASRSPR
jgi:hypothetical protein